MPSEGVAPDVEAGRGAPTGRRWLVDGMNVIGSRPDGWWKDRYGAMRALAAKLDDHQRDTGEAVTVVFDGEPPPYPIGQEAEVAFATGPGPNRADHEIVRRVSADPSPHTLRVVTSDRELADRVRDAGAEVVGSGWFRRRLDEPPAERGRMVGG